jgi:CRP/FNR family transcriptional regulator, cyclic AMP receptor protein
MIEVRLSGRNGEPPGPGRPAALMNEKIWVLKRCQLFELLTPEECRRLESGAEMRTFRRQEIIYFPTDPGQSVLVLSRGRVKIKSVTVSGKETILTFIEPGEVFGELALLDAEPRREFAEAVEEARVLAMPRGNLLWLMEHRPDVALHVTRLLGFRRRRIENRLRNLLFRSNRERIACLLLELLETYGRPADGGWEIRLRLSHQDLANLIGATRERVTVTLGQLQRAGLIAVSRRRLVVLDRARLTTEAEGVAEPAPGRRPGGRGA